MDWDLILTGCGLILCGVVIAAPVAFAYGRKVERQSFEYPELIEETPDEVWEEEFI